MLKDKYKCKKIIYNSNKYIQSDILNINVRDTRFKKILSCAHTILFDFTKYDYLLVEVGISEKNDIDKHIELYPSYISCFTELDYVHTEGMGDLDGICYEKSKLVNNSKYKIIKNNEIIQKYVENVNRIIVSEDETQYIYREQTVEHFKMNCIYKDIEYNVCIPNIKKNQFIPTSYCSLICFCLEVASILKMTNSEVELYLSNYQLPHARSSLVVTTKNNIVLDGSYNASFKSIIEILNSCTILNKNLNKQTIIILSDIKELNPRFLNYYEEISKMINSVLTNIEKVVLIGNEIKCHVSYKNIEHYNSTEEFINSNINYQNKLFVIKGSNYFKLKDIIHYL
jgi:UDP-N-acetylmuramyl pentapeptide synthase